MNDYLSFLSEDIQKGLLKVGRVGMIRRTLKWIDGRRIEEFIYLPQFREFIVFKIKELKGGLKE